jgi:hypothetical protein
VEPILHDKKFPPPNKFGANLMKAIFEFVVILTARFPQNHQLPKKS